MQEMVEKGLRLTLESSYVILKELRNFFIFKGRAVQYNFFRKYFLIYRLIDKKYR